MACHELSPLEDVLNVLQMVESVGNRAHRRGQAVFFLRGPGPLKALNNPGWRCWGASPSAHVWSGFGDPYEGSLSLLSLQFILSLCLCVHCLMNINELRDGWLINGTIGGGRDHVIPWPMRLKWWCECPWRCGDDDDGGEAVRGSTPRDEWVNGMMDEMMNWVSHTSRWINDCYLIGEWVVGGVWVDG